MNVVRSLLTYDPDTGEFVWLARVGDDRHINQWNAANAGSEAGWIAPDGYRRIGIYGAYYSAHRLAWLHFYGEEPGGSLDHIDGLRDNNRIANLRIATVSENGGNMRVMRRPKKHEIEAKGVHLSRHGTFKARIVKDGHVYNLGYFATEAEASAAYFGAAKVLFGNFARRG